MERRKNPLWFITLLPSFLFYTTADRESLSTRNSIVFATLGRSSYSFDIYTLPILGQRTNPKELKITDGESVNYNGHFPAPSPPSDQTPGPTPLNLVYVTERNGSSGIYLDALYYEGPDHNGRRSALQVPNRVQVPLVSSDRSNGQVSMKDRPNLVGDYLVYVSTHEDSGVPRTSWAAVYWTRLGTGLTRRLTPYGVADFSPAVSPSGDWTAVASAGERGWRGEVEELDTDIYIFRTEDGSGRVKVTEHGGWPSWADESTLYFHRRGDDGWWSIYRAILPKAQISTDSVVTQRVTPPGLHAFTPAASVANKSFVAVATRRPDSEFRHIELFDVVLNEFIEVTRPVSPHTHHFNPFLSPDSTRVGYHRCRGSDNGRKSNHLLLENIQSPLSEISLFRIDGSYPSFSPEGDRIAYVKFPGLYVVNRDGSGLRQVYTGTAFSTAWDPKRQGVVYAGVGPTFASEETKVDVISINVDDDDSTYKRLTKGGKNNAFPSPSPDGKWVVFRSGRSGHKNLYIMDALDGEEAGLHRLTEGPWTDTMCNWSPNGDWIAFASDRENPGSGSYELFMVHPNGTGLKKVVQSGSGGRTNHPWFSPDGKNIVFTTDYAAVSAEPISNPHHYQPYGDIFTIRLDGSGIRRLTHNSFEDGTPAWGPTFMRPIDVEHPNDGPHCSFEDCHWLSKFPNHGVEGAPSVSIKVQCGQ
ncbi:uncharacterized protein LOC130758546 [Actinidia eriantha]|uniref:uncharacterized protein LOC130758546 n=1 Tax=Actinidia eriantha TaxID=165200 RepID=UPI002583907A|nr:uncharacterized protein LOC130758546 [Actinidia eriantha]